MAAITDYKSPIEPTWCPGCGDYGIWSGLKMALVQLNLAPHEVILSFDIGCNSNMADKINAYVIKTLHGRSIPAAVGAKLANLKMPVIALGGDGGTLSEGPGHLLHAARANYDITFLLFNNGDYGLTTGQPTCTSKLNQQMVTEPWGVVEEPISPAQLALVSKATFVARAFSGDVPKLAELIVQGVHHPGFSFIEIMQNCPTYNKIVTAESLRSAIYDINTVQDYDKTNWKWAFDIAGNEDDHIASGVLYQHPNSVPYHQRLPHFKDKDRVLINEVQKYPISEFTEEFI